MLSAATCPPAIPFTHTIPTAMSAITKAAASLAAIAYLDAKHGISYDLKLGGASGKAELL